MWCEDGSWRGERFEPSQSSVPIAPLSTCVRESDDPNRVRQVDVMNRKWKPLHRCLARPVFLQRVTHRSHLDFAERISDGFFEFAAESASSALVVFHRLRKFRLGLGIGG